MSSEKKTPTLKKIGGVYYRRLADNEVAQPGVDLVTDNGTNYRPIRQSYTAGKPVGTAHRYSTAALGGVWRKLDVPAGHRVVELDEVLGARKVRYALITKSGAVLGPHTWDISSYNEFAKKTVREHNKAGAFAGYRDVVLFASLAQPAPTPAPAPKKAERPLPAIPAGYRIVGPDEKNELGDHYLCWDGEYYWAVHSEVGYTKNSPRQPWSSRWACVIRPLPKVASGHNPHKLTEDQVGVKDGWRLLSVAEVQHRAKTDGVPTIPEGEVEGLDPDDRNRGFYSGVFCGDELAWTYRTKRPAGYFLTAPRTTTELETTKEALSKAQAETDRLLKVNRDLERDVVALSKQNTDNAQEIAKLQAQASGNAVFVRKDGFQKPATLTWDAPSAYLGGYFFRTSEKDAFGRVIYRE